MVHITMCLPSGFVPYLYLSLASPQVNKSSSFSVAQLTTTSLLYLVLHLIQALNYRLWFLLPTAVLAGLGEIIGWAGRLWSSKNPTLLDPFLIQSVTSIVSLMNNFIDENIITRISTTIIAPTPLVAANFVILGQLITRLGPKYSRLSPRWCMSLFFSRPLCMFDHTSVP